MKKILDRIENEIATRGIPEEEVADIISSFGSAKNRRIIAGYSSVAVIDREGQKISIPALRDAVKNFMANSTARNVMVFHSDIQIGYVLPKWTDPDSGKVWETKVDDTGFFTVCEIRSDVEIADKVWAEVLNGTIRSFSIAGSSKSKHEEYENGVPHTVIDSLEILETTLCEEPVNSMSKFSVLWNPNEVEI